MDQIQQIQNTKLMEVHTESNPITTPQTINKKPRKPYTISKPRENWNEEEHQRFLAAIKLYERDWKKIEEFVGTKSVVQIRSHAQKFFIKLQRNGQTDVIPPPRPKRKSREPYPKTNKKDKNDLKIQSLQKNDKDPDNFKKLEPSNHLLFYCNNNSNLPINLSVPITPYTNWELTKRQQLNELHLEELSQAQYNLQQTLASKNDSDISYDVTGHVDYKKVYNFLSSVFNPAGSHEYHKKLIKEMNTSDCATVQILLQHFVKNLSQYISKNDNQTLLNEDNESSNEKEFSPSSESLLKNNFNINDSSLIICNSPRNINELKDKKSSDNNNNQPLDTHAAAHLLTTLCK